MERDQTCQSEWRSCQTKADQSQESGCAGLCSEEPTPLGERFVAKRLEARPAFERSVVVEVVADGGVSGGELLQASHGPEPRHRTFSPSKRQVRVLSPIVLVPAGDLSTFVPDLALRCAVRPNAVLTTSSGRPYRFIAFLRNFNAEAISRVFVTKDSRTSPS